MKKKMMGGRVKKMNRVDRKMNNPLHRAMDNPLYLIQKVVMCARLAFFSISNLHPQPHVLPCPITAFVSPHPSASTPMEGYPTVTCVYVERRSAQSPEAYFVTQQQIPEGRVDFPIVQQVHLATLVQPLASALMKVSVIEPKLATKNPAK